MLENEPPLRDYKYKIEINERLRDTKKIYTDSNRANIWVSSDKGKGVFKPVLGIRQKDLKAIRNSASHYGEFLAYKLAEKIGIPSCEVELVKKRTPLKYSKSGKSVYVPGCISYSDLDYSNNESLTESISILRAFREDHYDEYRDIIDPQHKIDDNSFLINKENSIHNTNIEVVIPAFESYARDRGSSDEDIKKIRQGLIDMTVFDCRFANRDRHDENLGLAITSEGKVRLYPMFDNEYILGLSEFSEDILKYSASRFQDHIDKDLYSRMGVTSKPENIGHKAMLTYLFTVYPKETLSAYEKVGIIKEDYLQALMDDCEGLSDLYKEYASRIFRTRKRDFEAVKEEYIDKDGNIIAQKLPGNKEMEFHSKNIKAGPNSKRKNSSKGNVSSLVDGIGK